MIGLLTAFFLYYGDATAGWWVAYGFLAFINFVKFCRDMT